MQVREKRKSTSQRHICSRVDCRLQCMAQAASRCGQRSAFRIYRHLLLNYGHVARTLSISRNLVECDDLRLDKQGK